MEVCRYPARYGARYSRESVVHGEVKPSMRDVSVIKWREVATITLTVTRALDKGLPLFATRTSVSPGCWQSAERLLQTLNQRPGYGQNSLFDQPDWAVLSASVAIS